MKHTIFLFFLITMLFRVHAQKNNLPENIIITYENKETQVRVSLSGQVTVNVSPDDKIKFTTKGYVKYSDFGAKGDGITDDIDAIAATHAFANQQKVTVKADKGYTYYISGKERTAIIKTDTDFGNAAFIIDDTEVQNRNAAIFTVNSERKYFNIKGLTSLKKHQKKIDVSLPGACLITVTNSNKKKYIRIGNNQSKGSSQKDIFIANKNGIIDMNTPIIWDFNNITHAKALPIDEKPIYINGGIFTTIANKAKSQYTYYKRNIIIKRSNVIVNGLEHYVKKERFRGAPYLGFIVINDCAYVSVKNSLFTGHKSYRTKGSTGKRVSMGTYDISINRALNVTFENCRQTNDINNKKYWGIMGSNFSKNLVFDNCSFSRIDAHQGVTNATIINSKVGYMGIKVIGSGTLRVENTTVKGRNFIELRPDYGSSWEGNLIIRNSIYIPTTPRRKDVELIKGKNNGQHNFGYTCYLPEKIIIDQLIIKDAKRNKKYKGPMIFGDFNPKKTNQTYRETYPLILTKEIIAKDVTTSSGKTLIISDNNYMFKDTRLKRI